MGMDVSGINPIVKTGEYFRANCWSWRPLHFLCMYADKQFNLGVNFDNWEYNDGGSERTYKINTNDRKIRVQYGRSQYDTTYVEGFKVLGKKGNKYSVEVYREGTPNRTYEVLEKKFESFIEDASKWEFEEANRRSEKIKRDFEERTKK
jgi:hypothetical protein